MSKEYLSSLYQVAVDASRPQYCLPAALTRFAPDQRVCILGAGKAAADMAAQAYQYFGDNAYGAVVTRYGYETRQSTGNIEVMLAAHPVPDEHSEYAARKLLDIAATVPAGEPVIFLISGGGSALACLPGGDITLPEKLALHRFLLRSGASIDEMNTVRKHVSAIKGGRLAAACKGELTTLAISDVVGDSPAMIASGPTVQDTSTAADAVAILQRYGWDMNDTIARHLETALPLPQVGGFYEIVANAQLSVEAAIEIAKADGWETHTISLEETGEAQEVARRHAKLALEYKQRGEPIMLFSGGELTVTLGDSQGEGGPNQEYLIALCEALRGEPTICALAADTDGVDGSKDVAGGYIDGTSLARAKEHGLNVGELLAQHNSFPFFAALDDHINVGPTRTNVNDFRVIWVK